MSVLVHSDKQKRQAKKIEEGYEKTGTPAKEARKRAWATVNKMWGGAQQYTDVEEPINYKPAKKRGKLGGWATAKRPATKRSASAQKAASTCKKHRKAD